MPPLLGEGSPTKRDYRDKDTLILTSLLEDLVTTTTLSVQIQLTSLMSPLVSLPAGDAGRLL